MATNEDQTLISFLLPRKKVKNTPEKKEDPESRNKRLSSPAVTNPSSFELIPVVKKHKLYLAILVLLVLIVYANSLDNSFVSDDKGFSWDRPELLTLKWIFGDPFGFVGRMLLSIEYAISGQAPFFYRFVNVLFHLGNTSLVFLILYILSKPKIAFFTAALFAVHPLLTEAVTWISGGGYAHNSFYLLLSLLLYITGSKRKKLYYASIVVYLIGLLNSNRIMTLFPVFFVYEFCFGDLKKNWKKLIPYLSLSLLWGLVYALQIGARQTELQTQYYLEKGWDNPLIQIPFALANYFILFFWPKELTFYHSDLVLSYIRLSVYWVMFLIYLGILIFAYLKNRFIFFWLIFFLIGLAFSLTPFRIGWVVAERYVYLSALGLIVPVAFYFNKLIENKSYRVP